MSIQPGFRTIGAYDTDPDKLDRQVAQLEQNIADAMDRIGQQAQGALQITAKRTGPNRAQSNDCIIVDSSKGNVDVLLPAPSPLNAGDTIALVRLSAANVVTVKPTSGTISGATSYVVTATAYLRVDFLCIGTDWVAR